ncbi:hypothetical protein D3C81_2307930 [compost metagenome]
MPVTSSSPSRMIITNPTGNTSAPTMPIFVWTVAWKARVVANPRIAPPRNPRSSSCFTGSRDLAVPA